MNIDEALKILAINIGNWSGSGAFNEEIYCVVEEVFKLRSQNYNLRNCHNCFKDCGIVGSDPCSTCIRSDEDYQEYMTDNWEGK